MRLQPTRPTGVRLARGSTIKVKGIMQVHKSTDVDMWDSMWVGNYDWTGWLKKGIDSVVALGGNTIKVVGPSYLVYPGGTLSNTTRDRMRLYLDYTASVGLRVYWCCQIDRYARADVGTTDAQNVSMVLQQASILNEYGHVIGLDMENEYNFPFGGNPSYAASCRTAVKAVAPTLPVTVSLTNDYLQSPSNGTLAALAPYVDYWDFHWYEATGVPGPTAADVSAFRASPHYKPFIFGESGTPLNGQVGIAQGVPAIRAHWQLLGDTAAAAPDCFGAVGFSLTDFDTEGFGVYPESFLAPKSQAAEPFAAWRSVK